MAGSFYDNKDSMDINELASLNDDISNEMLEQLQQQLTQTIAETTTSVTKVTTVDENDDSTLFEEPVTEQATTELPTESVNTEAMKTELSETSKNQQTKESSHDSQVNEDNKKTSIQVNSNFDDNFIKKYKAKLKNKAKNTNVQEPVSYSSLDPETSNDKTGASNELTEPIEIVSNGNISERPLTQNIKDYNDSLDFLDGDIKYSKYVIYIEPQNVDFIESLTVKERKNLINSILRQQEDIAITKQRFKVVQAFIRHTIIAILTVTLSIPVIYYAINTSLELTINNHRNAQSNWQVLYRENGKITQN